VVGTGLVVAGSTVLAPALFVGGLNAIGFTAGGVAGGSIAAGIHSAFYGGAATGLFSVCQSIGATSVAASGGSIMSALGIAAGATILNSRKDGDDSNPRPPESLDGRASRTSSPPPSRIDGKDSN
ncbi:hypothetical protein BDZ97DRAFT_1651552, partial [Flammula alnicola]